MWTGDGRPVTATPAATVPDVRDAATLKPGGFTWHPERAPSGPVVIIVPAMRGDFSHGRTRKTLKKKESSVCFRVFPWPRVGMMIKAGCKTHSL